MGRKLEREQVYLRNAFSSKTSSELKAAEEAGGPRSTEWGKESSAEYLELFYYSCCNNQQEFPWEYVSNSLSLKRIEVFLGVSVVVILCKERAGHVRVTNTGNMVLDLTMQCCGNSGS